MPKKRIAMISYHTCPLASFEGKETGGMNVYVYALSQALVARGYAVDMFTRWAAPDNPEIITIEKNFRNIHLPAGPAAQMEKSEMLNYLGDFTRQMEDFMLRYYLSYDVLHCHYYMSGLIGLELQKSMHKEVPIVMTFHTLGLLKNLVARREVDIEDNRRIEAEFTLVKEANRIVALSDLDFGYLKYLYGALESKLNNIPPGVDTGLFMPLGRESSRRRIGLESSGKLILFVGRAERLKGADLLLYALKILKSKNPSLEVCLMIVGGDVSEKPELWSGPIQSLEDLRKTLEISASVRFVSRKKQSELPYYYNAADLVVMPSHYESFGMVALEAMACGVPVITTDVTGISSLLDRKHYSLVTSVNNPFLLASQMEIILRHGVNKTLKHLLRKRVEDLSWENIAEKMEEVYQQALNNKSQTPNYNVQHSKSDKSEKFSKSQK